MPLVISTKSRPTPYLQEYLGNLLHRPSDQLWKIGVAGGVSAVVIALTSLIVSLAKLPAGVGTALWVVLNMALIGVAVYCYRVWKDPGKGADATMIKEARDIARQILNAVNNRKLYRAMHPAAIDLLEESARCWKRTNDAVNSPFWREKDLPEHYRSIRQQAMTSADRAMMEILINLRSAVRSVPQPQTVIEGITAALESVGIQIQAGVGAGEPLPVGFEKAADLAKNLAELASEVEQVSTQVIKSSAPVSIDSAENIRATLDDLRHIRAAESELDQDLRTGA